MPRLFLSYSSKDKQAVHRLAVALREAGVNVWLDQWEIKVGDQISQKIDSGLQNSDFLAIWLTNRSVASGWVQREWRAKFNEEISTSKKIVLPLLGEYCAIPALLRDKKYADFTRDFQEGLSELLIALGVKNYSPNHERTIFSVIEEEKCPMCGSAISDSSHYDTWQGDSDGYYPRYISARYCTECYWYEEIK